MYKKLVVFDFNMDWKHYDRKDERYKDKDLVFSLLKQANEYVTPVIVTSAWIVDAINFIANNNINHGYLIANGGAIIYNIAEQRILQINRMEVDDINALVHHGLMLNLNIVIYTTKHKYIYVCNQINYQRLANASYSPYELIKDYKQLQQVLELNDIVDVAYVNLFDNKKANLDNILTKLNNYFASENSNLIFKASEASNFIHIQNKQSTKLIALQYVMALFQAENMNDVLYVAATSIDRDSYLHFKNTLVTSNPDFIYEIRATKKAKYLIDEINNLSPDLGRETNSFWK